MYILFIILLVMLSILNYLLTNSLFYPPFVFSSFWAFLLLVLKLSGNMFYSVSNETLFLYFIGAAAFSLGGIFPLFFKISRKDEVDLDKYGKWPELIINLLLAVSLIVLPYYFYRLIKTAISSGFDNFWMGLKYQVVNNPRVLGRVLFRLRAFFDFNALLAYLEYKFGKISKKRVFLIFLIALIYELSTSQRAGAFRVVFALLGIKFVVERKVDYKFVLKMLVLFCLMFIIPAVLVGQIGTTESLVGIMSSGLRLIIVYLVGGLVSFNNVVASPSYYNGPRITTFRFFLALTNTMGFTKYELPDYIPVFTPTPILTNVYTIYFSYFMDLGYFGVFILTFLIGMVASFVFIQAYYERNKIFIFLYGLVISGIFISSMNEIFYTALSYWIQAILFLLIVYKLPLLFKRSQDEHT